MPKNLRFLVVAFVAIDAMLIGCSGSTANAPNEVGKDMNAKVEWPFADPKNLAVITIDRIVDGREPILYVSHDAEDGGWQFLDGGSVSEANAKVVSLLGMVERDATLRELADLPRGWVAERDAIGKPWRRFESQ